AQLVAQRAHLHRMPLEQRLFDVLRHLARFAAESQRGEQQPLAFGCFRADGAKDILTIRCEIHWLPSTCPTACPAIQRVRLDQPAYTAQRLPATCPARPAVASGSRR